MATPTITTTVARNAVHATGVDIATEGQPLISMRFADLTETIIFELAAHGLKQKIVDAAAIPRDATTGRSASPAEKHAAMLQVRNMLVEGEWTRREPGAGAEADVVTALVNVTGCTAEEARAAWASWSDEEKRAMEKVDSTVAPEVARIRRERAARRVGDVDTSAKLAGLMKK